MIELLVESLCRAQCLGFFAVEPSQLLETSDELAYGLPSL
jgi:hypothetical protein